MFFVPGRRFNRIVAAGLVLFHRHRRGGRFTDQDGLPRIDVNRSYRYHDVFGNDESIATIVNLSFLSGASPASARLACGVSGLSLNHSVSEMRDQGRGTAEQLLAGRMDRLKADMASAFK